MGTLPPIPGVLHRRLPSGSLESLKSATDAQYLTLSSSSVRLGTCNLGKKTVSGEAVHSAGQGCVQDQRFKVFAKPRMFVDPMEEQKGLDTEIGHLESMANYLFHIEGGGLAKVSVGRRKLKYVVSIKVSSVQLKSGKDQLLLNWRISKMPITFEGFFSGSESNDYEASFKRKSSGTFVIELEFKASDTPCNLSFLLKDSDHAFIRSHRKTSFCFPVGFLRGLPAPLGLSFSKDGSVNFALYSKDADRVVLCLYDDSAADKPALEIGLDPYVNRSGRIWHLLMECAPAYTHYGYRIEKADNTSEAGFVLFDPYAKVIEKTDTLFLGKICNEPTFDWSDDVRLGIPKEKLVVYRLNVKHFTSDKSSQLSPEIAGTFAGLTEKLTHLKDLGINAVLLEPIFSFHEIEGPYFPCHFFSPSDTYGPSRQPLPAIKSLKEMVKKLHTNGIEVLMEVVFSHTAKAGALQGIDDSSYYFTDANSETSNGLNCNYPIVQHLIIDSLHHWVTQYHVDGFWFINGSSLLKGVHGEGLSRPPLIESIAFDPLLSNTKIIVDCWTPQEMTLVDVRFPHWKKWAEVNSKFCKDLRNFLRGEGLLSDLATRLCGSGDKFSDGRGPAFSFNFISRNSGLSLVDLVSFSSGKALASELSWNCGVEGPTTKAIVLERRLKQIRNYLFILYVSLGIPVLNMGDECGQSTGGSTSYQERKPLDWNALKTGFGTQITQFISFLSSLRTRRSDLLQRRDFLKVENIDWYGSDQSPPKWEDPTSKFLAVTLRAEEEESELVSEPLSIKGGDLFLAFNAADHDESVLLPQPPEGMEWLRLVDTALPFPGFFSSGGEPVTEQLPGVLTYEMKPYSCSLFEAKSLVNATPSLL